MCPYIYTHILYVYGIIKPTVYIYVYVYIYIKYYMGTCGALLLLVPLLYTTTTLRTSCAVRFMTHDRLCSAHTASSCTRVSRASGFRTVGLQGSEWCRITSDFGNRFRIRRIRHGGGTASLQTGVFSVSVFRFWF